MKLQVSFVRASFDVILLMMSTTNLTTLFSLSGAAWILHGDQQARRRKQVTVRNFAAAQRKVP